MAQEKQSSKKSAFNRRDFLKAGSLAGAAFFAQGCDLFSQKSVADTIKAIPGELVGASAERGHRLRVGTDRDQKVSAWQSCPVLIVGAGASGLAAAWRLKRAGFHDFQILELEDVQGGTARSGQNKVSAFPWGAHYLPTPPSEARALKLMLREFGAIIGDGPDGQPLYNSRYICSAPMERLYQDGFWLKGLWPSLNASAEDSAQKARFEALTNKWLSFRDDKQRKAFTLPSAEASRDPRVLALDEMSMAQWLKTQGLNSERLRWFVEYGARDDFGSLLDDVSAWSMLHYTCARAQQTHEYVLTWPEGNGWLIENMKRRCSEHIQLGQMAVHMHRVKTEKGLRVRTKIFNCRTQTLTGIESQAVIFTAPKFIAPFVIEDLKAGTRQSFQSYDYSPWFVANITVNKKPAGSGAALAWDNVFYQSPSLGYVVATHSQALTDEADESSVLSYYFPLTDSNCRAARGQLLAMDREALLNIMFTDLLKVHPQLLQTVTQVDFVRWGHAMIRPKPGFIWNAERRQRLESEPSIHFAGADCSGLPLFEEAHYYGVKTAESVLRELGRNVSSIL